MFNKHPVPYPIRSCKQQQLIGQGFRDILYFTLFSIPFLESSSMNCETRWSPASLSPSRLDSSLPPPPVFLATEPGALLSIKRGEGGLEKNVEASCSLVHFIYGLFWFILQVNLISCTSSSLNSCTGCSGKIVFFHNSLQPLPRLHCCKRPSKLST